MSRPAIPLEELLDAIAETGSHRAAGEKLGISKSAVTKRLGRARKAGRLTHARGHNVDAPYLVKGVSTLYGPDGGIKLQWEKTTLDREKLALVNRAALEAMVAEIRPVSPVPLARSAGHLERTLCTVYTLTDAHIGMYAVQRESGRDWSLEIAEQIIWRSLCDMIDRAPAAKRAVIAQLGDFMHFDGLLPVTPSSGHVLDASGRYHEIVRIAVRTLRRSVERALEAHERVDLIVAEGNHDLSGSIWLRHMLAALYEGEPRVHVAMGELPAYALTHGEVMLGWHHGHLIKPADMPLWFASAFAAEWGATRHRYLHCGHRHHTHEREMTGATVVQHPALAAPDAHAARSGYRATPRASAITYHEAHGEVARSSVASELWAGKRRPAA